MLIGHSMISLRVCESSLIFPWTKILLKETAAQSSWTLVNQIFLLPYVTRERQILTVTVISVWWTFSDDVNFLSHLSSVKSFSGCSALHTAAKSGHASCVMKLLQYKVRVGSQDANKMTALHHAGIVNGIGSIVYFQQSLLEVYVTYEHKCSTFCHLSNRKLSTCFVFPTASKGHANCVKVLISNGAKLNVREKVLLYIGTNCIHVPRIACT